MKFILLAVLAGLISCAAVRPVDVCVDLPKVTHDGGATLDGGAADARGD
jgi:hypothetical protein